MELAVTEGPIIHVVQHLRPGGLEVMALELARAQATGRPTMVLSLEGTETEAHKHWPRLASETVPLLFLDKKPGLDPRLPGRIWRLFRRLRPSCVHTHHIGPLLYAGTAARLAGVRHRIHTEHDAWHLREPDRVRMARLALAIARPVLVADAPHVAEAVAKELGVDIPTVIMNGIDTVRFAPGDGVAARAQFGLPLDQPVIGIAARLEDVKRVDLAIRGFASIGMSEPILAIAGRGSLEKELRALAVSLGIADRVRFLGHVDAMVEFYRALDLFCLSSRAEGLPLSILEAQACDVPVVATEVGGIPAAVCDVSSRLVPPNDPAALAVAMRESIVQRNGSPRGFVLRNASLVRMTESYLALIESPAQGKTRNARHMARNPALAA